MATRAQDDYLVRIFLRCIEYTGVGLLVFLGASVAVRFWLPDSTHSPVVILSHSLVGVLRIRSFGRTKPDSD